MVHAPKPSTRRRASIARFVPHKQATPVKKISIMLSNTGNSQTEAHTTNIGPSVMCREKEYALIKARIDSFLAYGIGTIMYLTGVPGSGKTYTVLAVLRALGMPYAHINCSKLKKKQDIFKTISTELACCEKCDAHDLKVHLRSCDQNHLVFVDEVDFLRTKNEVILYNLFELPHLPDARILLIVISNTLGVLNSRVESRMGKDRIEFMPYKAEDLRRILESAPSDKQPRKGGAADKKRGTLPKRPADLKSLELISKRVACSTGDIRKAFELAEKVGDANFIKADSMIKEISAPLIVKFIRALGYYQKLVIFLNMDQSKNLLRWFSDFKTFCKLRGIDEIDFFTFSDLVSQLSELGIYKVTGISVGSVFYREEFEQAMKEDPVFESFGSK